MAVEVLEFHQNREGQYLGPELSVKSLSGSTWKIADEDKGNQVVSGLIQRTMHTNVNLRHYCSLCKMQCNAYYNARIRGKV